MQEGGHRNRLCQLLLLLLRSPLQRTLCLLAALSKDLKQIHWPDECIYKKTPKPYQEKEVTLSDFGSWCWKGQTVKFHSMLFLPFHCLCILLLRPLSLQTDGETDNFGKTEACSLLPHKHSASFCMCLPQGFLIFPYIGHRPEMHQTSNSVLMVFCSLHHIV